MRHIGYLWTLLFLLLTGLVALNANEDSVSVRILNDLAGNPIVGWTYEYDEEGHCLNETIWGNLSGHCKALLCLNADGKPLANGIEHYTVHYRYDSLGRLVLRQEENGAFMRYLYEAESQLPCTVEIGYGEEVVLRQGWQSDDQSNIKAQWLSDGATLNLNLPTCVEAAATKKHPPSTSAENALAPALKYMYDTEGRITSITLPTVIDAEGNSVAPVYTFTYDIGNRPVTITDPQGNKTLQRYTARGSLAEICYPDGTRVQAIYALDGALQKQIARDGTAQIYVRDPLQRLLHTTTCAADNTPIQAVQHHYQGWRCCGYQDAAGTQLTATYNVHGQEQSLSRSSSDGPTWHAEHLYSKEGVYESTKLWHNSSTNDYAQLAWQPEQKTIAIHAADGTALVAAKNPAQKPALERQLVSNKQGQKTYLETHTASNGYKTTIAYDALDRPEELTVQDTAGATLRREELRYDLCGHKVRHTVYGAAADEVLHVEWEYTPCHALQSVTFGAGTSKQQCTRYSYDERGLLCLVTKPDGHTLRYGHDAAGRLSSLHASDGTVSYRYSYDAANRVIAVEDEVMQATTWRSYNDAGHIIAETLAHGLRLERTYDLLGRCTCLMLPDGSAVVKEYDAAHLRRIERKDQQGAALYHFDYLDYNSAGQPTRATLIKNLGSMTWHYLPDGHLAALDTPQWHTKLNWQGEGLSAHLAAVATTQGDHTYTSRFEADKVGRLIREEHEDSAKTSFNYTYDWLENRLTGNCKDTTDALGAIKQLGDYSVAYDASGNITCLSKPDSRRELAYDALGRLTSVVIDDTTKIVYSYDPFNRLLKRACYRRHQEKWEKVEGAYFLYDGSCDIGTFDEQGACTALRVLGVGMGCEAGAAVALELNGHLYAPLHDSSGSLAALVEADTGKIAASYRYSAYGQSYAETNEAVQNPWRFAAKRLDPATGWLYFGQRHYTPDLGRWLTPDPAGTSDGCNRYLYAHNRPMVIGDAYGLFSVANVWEKSLDHFSSGLHYHLERASITLANLREKYGFWNTIQPTIDRCFKNLFSASYLQLTGYFYQQMLCDSYGTEEINPYVRVTLINGMGNIHDHVLETLKLISETHGDTKIHYVFHPTAGWTHDLFYCAAAKLGYVSPHAKQLAAQWSVLLHTMGEKGHIYHYAHSIGGTDTYSAIMLLPIEEQKRIRVVTIGSPTFVPAGNLESVDNYASRSDGVPIVFGYLTSLFSRDSKVEFLGSFLGLPPLCDHTLTNDGTYGLLLRSLGAKFLSYARELEKTGETSK